MSVTAIYQQLEVEFIAATVILALWSSLFWTSSIPFPSIAVDRAPTLSFWRPLMRKVSLLAVVLLLAAVSQSKEKPGMPALITNATYVFVTTYDGDLLNPDLTPEDRQAVNDVLKAIEKWGRYKLVYKFQQADLILVVRTGRALEIKGGLQKSTTVGFGGGHAGSAQSFGAEAGDPRDILAVYAGSEDVQGIKSSPPLWRDRAVDGLQGS
jgi:hypothetical protein